MSFDREVRPLLADRCYPCHGPDAAARQAELRLDDREFALRAVGSGRRAIVPGNVAASELFHRIESRDDSRMPPPTSGRALSDLEVALLRRWIEEGAAYDRHWAFVPLPEVVPLPMASSSDVNAIDVFLDDELERQGLERSGPTSPERWLRRVTFALTGLPPTPAERAAFVANPSAAARSRVVERLLASSRYGERMAADWMDVSRYADTFGYQADVDRPVWPWRDGLLRAFNCNQRFDEFLTWQLAGDLLPDASEEQVLATAFQRLHRQTNEGGSVEEEMRLESVADRTETFANAFLGLTIGCARCHDHKFDPLSQREHYALSAFFDNIDESGLYSHFTRSTPTPALGLPSSEQRRGLEQAEQALEDARLEFDRSPAERREAFRTWQEGRAAAAPAAWPIPGEIARFPLADVGPGATLRNLVSTGATGTLVENPSVSNESARVGLQFHGDDGARFPGVGEFSRTHPFTFDVWLESPKSFDRAVVLHRSRAWTDAGSRGYELLLEEGRLSFALVHFWPGNALRVRAVDPLPLGTLVRVTVTYDGSTQARGAKIYQNGEALAVTVVRDGLTRRILGGGADALTLAHRFRDRGFAGGRLADLRVFDRDLSALEVRHLPEDGIPAVIARTDAMYETYLATTDDVALGRARRLMDARTSLAAVQDDIPEIMVMRESQTRRATFVRTRGAYDHPRDSVDPDTPGCLPPFPVDQPRNRLGLARWLTDPRHPLTARVFVNRVWQMHFGRGLVETAEDFGTQGSRPTHPQLLDWLARRFVDSGFDIKALHRLVVSSEAFGRSTRGSESARVADPDNRWYSRGQPLRLSAEMIRDQALYTSGLLVERLGGPPVRPYQPPGLWEEKSGAAYLPDTGEGLYRRSLYTFWKRTSPPPGMILLDAPEREVSCSRRQRTTTPLQMLLLLNDPQYVEASRAFAERLVREPSDGDLAPKAFEWLIGRTPTAAEREVLCEMLAKQQARYRAEPALAAAALAVGQRSADARLDPIVVASLASLINVLFTHDEAVTLR